MKKPEVWKLVLEYLLPAKSDFCRDDWRIYVHRYLLPEIQSETLRFYGETTSAEALHPGLDYVNPGHRARLTGFPRHKQLFSAFDKLRLTDFEIQTLCRWEGTLPAKTQFERQHETQIKDTTWDGVIQYKGQTPSAYVMPFRQSGPQQSALRNTVYEPGLDDEIAEDRKEVIVSGGGEEDTTEEVENETNRTHSVELNRRLTDGAMDADWEQWMKEAIERGDVSELLNSSRTQALRTIARLSNQNQAQFEHNLGSASPLPSLGFTSSQAHWMQPQRDSITRTLSDGVAAVQHPRHSFWRAPPSSDLSSQIQPPASSSSGPLRSVPQIARPSSLNTPNTSLPSTMTEMLDPMIPSQAHQWEGEVTEIHSAYPRLYRTGLQDALLHHPQYPQFFPAGRLVSAPARGPSSAGPSTTPSTSVPA